MRCLRCRRRPVFSPVYVVNTPVLSAECCWQRRPWDGQKTIVEKKHRSLIQPSG